jgi:hypothetical protein
MNPNTLFTPTALLALSCAVAADSMDVDYRVIAINQAGVTANQGVSNVESFTPP